MGLFKPAWQSANEKKALKAIRKITDKNTLFEIMENVGGVRRKEAANVLINMQLDQKTYADITEKYGDDRHYGYWEIDYSEEWEIAMIAVKKLSDIELLNNIARNSKVCPSLRDVACEKIQHDWDGCKCNICGKTRDEQHDWYGCKCKHCSKVGNHDWDGCKCKRCGKTRDEQHDWDGCECKRCSKVGNHDWDGCKCKRCGKTRNEQHDWDGCKCKRCGEFRDEQHDWDGCKCKRCRKTRDEQHDWDGCKCKRCGEIDHYWVNGKCEKCGFECGCDVSGCNSSCSICGRGGNCNGCGSCVTYYSGHH